MIKQEYLWAPSNKKNHGGNSSKTQVTQCFWTEILLFRKFNSSGKDMQYIYIIK